MAIHTKLDIYKVAFDLLKLATGITRNMPRDLKHSLGGKIQGECVEMLVLVGRANIARDKTQHIEALLERHHVAELLLRLAHEMKFISHSQWAESVQALDAVGKQAGGWLKHSRQKMAPEA